MIEARIDKLVGGGDGLARQADGRVVFIPGVLPGELVRAEIVSAKKDYAKARLIEVLEASPGRRVPPCPYVAAGCGGCDWQHIEPARQLELKTDIVRDALARTARLADAEVFPGGQVSEAGYRTTLRLAVDGEGRVGFRAAASHRVVPIERCMVADEAVNEIIAALAPLATDEMTLRVGLASKTAASDHGPLGLDRRVSEVISGVPLQVGIGSFFQSGPQAAELLVDAVRRAAGEEFVDTPVVDAYGGVGLFAATLGGPGSVVVESNRAATADAKANLRDRKMTIVTSPMEKWRPGPAGPAWMVADPARAGLGRDGVRVVGDSGVRRLVLVSCDPVAMARDTGLLVAAGFAHRRSEVLDLFPNTHHVEVVTRFDRIGEPT